MKKLIAATKNKGKLREIGEILAELDFEIQSMEAAGVDIDIEENGSTFEENAVIKARAIAEAAGVAAMGDDSGLEVDCLGGIPGIYSARFGGEGASDSDKNEKLLGMLKTVPPENRNARFVCAIAVVFPDGTDIVVRGTCEGYIADKPEGENGFGYDPVFYMPDFGKTMAQLGADEKNSISHRGRALKLMCEELKKKCGKGW